MLDRCGSSDCALPCEYDPPTSIEMFTTSEVTTETRRFEHAALFAALIVLVMGCGRAETDKGSAEREPAGLALEREPVFEGGTYAGVLPCASCPGIRTRISFAPDGTFRRHRDYMEGQDGLGRAVGDYGRWALTPGNRLVLRNTEEDVTRFEIPGPDEIRMLDVNGQPIESELNYSLMAETDVPEEDGVLAMSGMYTYMADAAIFKPCNLDRTIPVAMVERHADLEQEYMHRRSAPGAPLMVRIDARLEEQPAMEGEGTEETVVVTKLDEVFEGRSCRNTTSLTDSVGWILVELDGIPVERSDPAMIPSLTFGAERVTGSTGCNQLNGPYGVAGDSLRFGSIAVTEQACADTLEAAFVDMLGDVETYGIYGDELDFMSRDRLAAVLELRAR